MSADTRGALSLGVLFDVYADKRRRTVFRLSRPFDVAPEAGTAWTVAELATLVRECAGWFHAAGAGAGDRVAIVKPNHWDCVLLACAASRVGAVPAMISGHLPSEALEVLLKRLEPRVLVTTSGILSAARAAGAELASHTTRVLSLDGADDHALTLDDVRGENAPGPRRRDPDEPLIVVHTSGTTGVPKLVEHSANTIMGHLGRTESIRWPVVATRRNDTIAMAIAFVHGRSLPWTTGTLRLEPREALVLADPEPETAERIFAEHPPSAVEALPNTFIRWEPLARSEDSVFANVRLYISTFDAMHPPTIRAFLGASKRRFPVWLQGWGQSEAGPLAFRLLTRRAVRGRGERHPTTRDVGRPIPGFTRLRVVDPKTMRAVRAGRPGVVLARTNGRCLSYIGEQDRWQRKASGGWWNTGDVGSRSRTGRVHLLDREVDVVPGMSCIEMEDILTDRIPGVLEIVIVGGQGRPPLPVVCTEGGRLEAGVWDVATRDLPALSDPVLVAWEEIPRTGTGKVRRQELRERLLGQASPFGSGRWT